MPNLDLASRPWALFLITFTVAPAFRTVVLLAIAGSWIMHSLIHVLIRYRIPFVEPVALLYAGAALADQDPHKQEPDRPTPRRGT
jgi:hypothetical protein